MTSMDYYSLDKHCPSILSPPVISSTCSGISADNGLNDSGSALYVGSAASGNFRGVPADSCSYGHVSLRHDNGLHVKMELLGGSTTVEVSDHNFGGGGGGQYAYYNLNGSGTSMHHSSHMGDEHGQLKKNGGHLNGGAGVQQQSSYHHMQSSPAYSSTGSVVSNCPMSPMESMYGNGGNGGSIVKEEFENHHTSIYSMQACTPSQSSGTSPLLSSHSLPDSPPIVSSNSAGYHSGGSRHSLSPPSISNANTPTPNHHHHHLHHSSHSRNNVGNGGLCIAKKSSSSSSSSSSSTTSSNVCYELKREMAESSGLSLNGAPYAKSRAGRKGASNIASSTGSNSEANQFTDADSNSGNPSSKAFVPCKVCGDKASGYHYGVTSCEGCKGFFRRSIQKQIEYRCLRDGKCLIIRLNRNRCQYCRFKKCLAVGMSRDSVRYGRVPKKSKEKERLEEKANGVTQAEADQSSVVDIDAKDLALYDTILTISQAHHANCSYTDDKIKGLAKKPIFIMTSHIKLESNDECSSSPDVGSVSESMETQKIELWEQLALLITPCIQRVVEFAKRIPGFSELTQDDQLILIKLGFFEVWLVHISKTADFVENTLTFADGSFLNRKQLELMFDHEFVGNLFHLMSGLNNLALNDTEIGLFAAIILLQSDRPQIYDIKAINKIQENVMEALKTQITRNHSNDTATFQKLMQKINELRALGSSHSLHLQWFRSNWLRLHLPPLFAEIWDIPLPKPNNFANATPVANTSVVVVSQSSISPRDQQQQPQQTNSAPMNSPIEN